MSEGTSATINKIKASGRLVATREREYGPVVPAHKLSAELKPWFT